MKRISYKEDKNIDKQLLLNLYNDCGWIAYTQNPELLVNAIHNSLFVLTAWDNNKLIGLLRIVGDGLTIVYIQDILVLKSYRQKKVGTTLMKSFLKKFNTVRQKVLLTEENMINRKFYESLGFISCDKGDLVSFVLFKKQVQN